MSINNSYDIYNATLNADNATVDAIVSAILTQLETCVANTIPTFDFDLTGYYSQFPMIQQNRINDRVICILRDKGIRARIKVAPLSNPDPSLNYPFYSVWFNNISSALSIITITWYSRNAQEYQKTYC